MSEEEIIDEIEELIKEPFLYFNNKIGRETIQIYALAISILRDYYKSSSGIIKKQQKEIEKLQEENILFLAKEGMFDYMFYRENYIPKSKIEEKIKELKDNVDYLKTFKDWYEKDYTNEDIINNCLEVLQELLESEE